MEHENVVKVLREAAHAVEAAEIADDLRPSAFSTAAELLTGSMSGEPEKASNETDHSQDQGSTNGGVGGVTTLVQKSGISADAIETIFAERDGDLEVIVGSARIAQRKNVGTQELALLTVGARQIGGWDEDGWTDVERIREVCRRYNRFQRNHFAESLAEWTMCSGSVGQPEVGRSGYCDLARRRFAT